MAGLPLLSGIVVVFQWERERRRKRTQSAVITLEILDVTMEAFVSLLNGLPGHSFADSAESIFRLFNFIIAAAPRGGFFLLAWRKKKLAVAKHF